MLSLRSLNRSVLHHFPFFRHSRQTRSSLLSLPPELLHQIALHLASDIPSTNALSRTSRYLHNLATPLLYSHATDILRTTGTTPLRASCSAGKVHCVRALLAFGVPPDTREDHSGTTPLHAAIMQAHYAIVELLVQAGASVHLADHNGWTPLHWAVMSRDGPIARLLLEHGARADASARFGGGGTPVHFAAVSGRWWGGGGGSGSEMVAVLLERGASVDVVDYHGVRPVEYGVEVGDDEAVRLILAAGALAPAPAVIKPDGRMVGLRIGICQGWWQVSVLEEQMRCLKWG